MKVLVFGATGMVGQGVLHESLRDGRVARILSVVRSPSGRRDAKLEEVVLGDLGAVADIADRLSGFDACFYCLGVSSVGMSEADYARITYDLTVAIAGVLVPRNPAMTFIYVSGAGADRGSRLAWARVKARTEDALAALPFRSVYIFRPGFIQPLDGAVSRTAWYRLVYAAIRPVSGVLIRWLPTLATTTQRIGRAMIAVAATGYRSDILETSDINEAGTDPA